MESLLNEQKIQENILRAEEKIHQICAETHRDRNEIQLMAVTKTMSVQAVNCAVRGGISLLGENRVQEYLERCPAYLPEAKVHFIGTLQTNKVKSIVGKVSVIESLNSLHLAEKINAQAGELHMVADTFVEVNIGLEPNKHGLFPQQLADFLDQMEQYPNLRVRGLMTIIPKAEQEREKELFFEKMYRLFLDNKSKKIDNVTMEFLSMGMSGDYPLALRHGANIIRLGTAVFGKRAAFGETIL